mgnify:CR=1 FL=1
MNIIDLKKMPKWNPSVPNGGDSVSQGLVKVATNKYGITYPNCHRHGAMNKVSADGIWRCLACHEGCYELR